MPFLDHAETGRFEAGDMPSATAEDFASAGLSDRDVAYATQVQPGFDALRQAASLLTGLLLLDLTDCDRTVRDRALHAKALDEIGIACEAILTAIPHRQRAIHHHYHLKRALSRLEQAAVIASRKAKVIASTDTDTLFALIQSSWDELKTVGQLIGGFETIDLSQSCCAFHAGQIASAHT